MLWLGGLAPLGQAVEMPPPSEGLPLMPEQLEEVVDALLERVSTLEAELNGNAGDKLAPAVVTAERHLDTSWLLITWPCTHLRLRGFRRHKHAQQFLARSTTNLSGPSPPTQLE